LSNQLTANSRQEIDHKIRNVMLCKVRRDEIRKLFSHLTLLSILILRAKGLKDI